VLGSRGEGADSGRWYGNLSPDGYLKLMTVLKGQAASALYGFKSLQLCDLITTKRGSKGGGWSVIGLYDEHDGRKCADRILLIGFSKYMDRYWRIKPCNSSRLAQIPQVDCLGEGRLDGSPVNWIDGNQYPYSPTSDGYINFYRNRD